MNENNNNSSFENTKEKIELKRHYPLKIIKTNRAECDHIKEDNDFNLFDYVEEDFFSKEKAIQLKKEEDIINEKEKNKIFLNFMPAVKSLKRVTDIKEEKNNLNNNISNQNINIKKANNGVLYEFLYSDRCNIDLLITYLHKEKKISIIDTLIELMHQKYISQSLIYLPQLCMFFNYKEYYSPIKSYLLDRCADQIKFALQITWLLNSFIEDETPLEKSDIYEWLLQIIEETLVNGERNTIKVFNQFNQLQKEETNNNISNYFCSFKKTKEKNEDIIPFSEKQSRLLYFNICKEFYSSLKFMCEDLKNYPKENDERKNKFMEYIKNFNQNIKKQRIDNEENLLNYPSFFGIILPFNDSSSTEDIDSNLIVRIIPEQSFCFSSKSRVFTKICAECIQVKELKNTEYFIHKSLKINETPNKTNNFYKSFTLMEQEKNEFHLNKFLDSGYQRKKTTKNVRQLSFINHNIYSNIHSKSMKFNNLSYINEEEDKADKLRNFLYNINKTIKEEKENKIKSQNKNEIKNNEITNINIIKEVKNELIDECEILPEINEELKNVFGKPMNILKKEMQQKSPFKKCKTFKLVNFIAKANDDLRQDLLAMQLIKFFDKIFKEEKIPLHLRPYEILITSSNSGLIEFLENTASIARIKKKMPTSSKNLFLFYKKYFNENLKEAQINFTRSLAAYSLICYYLQIKDRHNGNILIDMYGNIIHIDFGFILGTSPGGINFEKAPFKLTKEYVEIMGGIKSFYYKMYKDLMVKGMIACKKYVENFICIVEIMSKGSNMPCFEGKNIQEILKKFRERFYIKKKDEDFIKIVDDLIDLSYDNFRTNQYDNYQKITNGILS